MTLSTVELSQARTVSEVRLSCVPCDASASSEAEVSTFFVPKKDEQTGDTTNTLHGRKLVGREIDAPEGYTFFVRRDNEIIAKAQKVTHYGHDRPGITMYETAKDFITLSRIAAE
ncbi:hypothetical protein J8273_5100 [Carpediemonas membranifera]|uniref:Uncharacterized protein n=1 Tax=Carpediemonas membranifera TaxID=201153 RepID=A0A8J6BW65_9EUKA|nr:hypothetical protein J8273_5100 [Carpediemonas membranifera]|eukprot:KAG9392121.1 hypothetical protein J8273_5100 [Carpediemonas membranifera]